MEWSRKERLPREEEWGRDQGDEGRESETILHPNGFGHSQIPISRISHSLATCQCHCCLGTHNTLDCNELLLHHLYLFDAHWNLFSCSIIPPSFPSSCLVGDHKLAHRATEKFGVTGFEGASRVIDCRRFWQTADFLFWVLGFWV